MRALGLALLVTAVTGTALATEPEAPSSPYTSIDSTRGPARPSSPARLEGSLSVRQIRVGLGSESDESFASPPVESGDDENQAAGFDARSRLLTIRKELDDDRQSECIGVPHRLVRRALEDSLDPASLSPSRQLRTSLD